MKSKHRPLNCIVPEHMLEKLLKHPNQDVQESAYRTLIQTERMRGVRHFIGAGVHSFAVPGTGLRRTIYDAQHAIRLPGKAISNEGTPPTDVSGQHAYDDLGKTYAFYKNVFNRDSIDGQGLPLDASVHYSVKFNNAFWNGRQMVFGDGDGVIFQDFTKCLDVVAHELTHGVTQYECNLEYSGQSGALNESISDVFGSLVKQYSASPQQTAQDADWLIGAGLFGPTIRGEALRSMKAPGTAYLDDPILGSDPQPDHMTRYDKRTSDNGGVHINSGIPNKAFYLCAAALGGYAWEKAGKIWYVSLRRFDEHSTFQQAADVTHAVAVELYGANSKEASAVGNAWSDVGIDVASHVALEGIPGMVDNFANDWDSFVDTLADQVTQRVVSRLPRKRGRDGRSRSASDRLPSR